MNSRFRPRPPQAPRFGPRASPDRPPFSAAGRRLLVMSVLGLAVGVLVYRLCDLQWWSAEPLRERGVKQYIKQEQTQAYRGMIVDRNDEPLAVSKRIVSLRVQPLRLADELRRKAVSRPDVTVKLAALAQMNVSELQRLLATTVAEQRRAIEAGELSRPRATTLWQGVNPGLKTALRQLQLDNVWTETAYWRYYPDGEITGHLLGLTDKQQNGLSGLENSFNRWLSGSPGRTHTIRDKYLRPVAALSRSVAPQPGRKLRLSVDRRLQYIVYKSLREARRKHRAKAAYAVLLDVVTGELLALVNQPGSDPNDYANRDPSRLRNRAAVDLFEPGSTVKPFTVAAALSHGLVSRHERIDTDPGVIKVGRYRVRDVHRYGQLDLAGVVIKSSNVGIIKIAQRLQPEHLWRLYSDLGFGRRTPLTLLGERRGRLRHHSDWTPISQATQSYGYGLSVTALQLAQAYAVLAADGVRRPLSLQRLERPLPGSQRVLSAAVSREVLAILERVTQPGGTAQRAAVSGYRVAGKTGTVQKSRPGGGYDASRHTALFAGIVPVSRPRLVMVVVIDQPGGKEYYGGVVAAPVFSDVMRQALPLLGIPPDGLLPETVRIAARGDIDVPPRRD